jgi:hypothetical protein
VELRWHRALAREAAKWRHNWVVGRVTNIEMTFYSYGRWESDCPGRVADGSAVNSLLWFWLKRRGDRIKHCQNMKQRQRARLGSMGRKRDTVRRRDDVDRRRGGTEEGKERRRHLLSWRESWTKKWRKFTRRIQLLQMNGEYLKQRWVNLFF